MSALITIIIVVAVLFLFAYLGTRSADKYQQDDASRSNYGKDE